MIKYLNTLPIVTKMTKFINLTLNKPETKVKGSPIMGSQANNNDHIPNLLNHFEDLFICFSLKGNHFLDVKFLE